MMECLDVEKGWYGEWVFYENLCDKKEGVEYLQLWKKFFCKKMNFSVEHEQLVDHENINGTRNNTLGLKIKVKHESSKDNAESSQSS